MNAIAERAVTGATGAENGVLAGVRIIDFSRMLPGPWCSQMLADLGAEVIKIEQPGVGDLGRHNSPNFRHGSVYFNTVNLNKRSVTLDLSQASDREAAHRLIASADVVIESFRDGVPERLEIDYDTARKLNHAIVYCSITGFGHSGPLAAIPGHDLVVQSTAGALAPGSYREGAPPLPPFQAGDYAAASYAVIAILSALRRKDASGAGGYLDISMFDSLFSMMNIIGGSALAKAAGNYTTPPMELWGGNPRYDTYPTRDGKAVAVSLLEARIWYAFCRLIGRADLIVDDEGPEQRHSSHGERAEQYRQAIAEVCLSRPRDELVAWMEENDVPILPVHTPEEAAACPHTAARGLVQWIDHPSEGRIPVLANPLARSGLTRAERRPAPDIGADNEAVLAELTARQAR